tara:strand:+ start:124 stop:615 length:492 start_codon:yes stop_codon:yes gene_type:complete
MKNKKIKIISFLLLLFFFNNCGFSPVYKFSDSSLDLGSYSISILNSSNTSKEVIDEIKDPFSSSSGAEKIYIIEINAVENLEPLITNTDGTVSKYRIEIILNFNVKDKSNNAYIIEDVVRGFAQYTVETSEIESSEIKKRMVQTATSNAIQMMISKIQSDSAF